MQARRFIIRTILLPALLVSAAGPARCQPPAAAPAKPPRTNAASPIRAQLLKDAQSLLLRQRYRAAERLLSDALEGPASKSSNSGLSVLEDSLMATLGEVLVESGKYEPARIWLERAMQGYDRAASPSRRMLAEQAATAIWLSKAYGHLDKTEQARGAIDAMLDRYRRARVADTVVELELLAQRAALDEPAHLPGNGAAEKDATRRLAEALAADRRRGVVGIEDHARGLASLAECQLHTADWAAATQTAEKLICLRADRHEILEEITARKRLAEIHRRQADSRAEIETLQTALDALQREQTQGGAVAEELRVRLRYERAELQRLLGVALLLDHRNADASKQFLVAQDNFAAVLAEVRRAKTASAVDVSEGRLLERLADVAGQRVELGASDPQHLQTAIGAHAELLDHCRQTLLPEDPRLAAQALILGGLHLKLGEWRRAQPLLQEALAYWRRHEPPNRLRLAQSLHLLGETELLAVPPAPATSIEQHLRESHGLCLSHFPEAPLRWQSQLALGRLYLASGRYRQARDLLQAAADSPRSVPADVRGAAWLQLGLLHKQLLRFDEADRFCRQGLELRLRTSGKSDPELAPFYLALGSLQVARRDAAALDELVASAGALGVAESPNAAWRWEFAHQQAMTHYLRNELAGDGGQRQAARSAWEQLLAREPELPAALRARTLHYLARLDYLDWSNELDAWNRDFIHSDAHSSRLVAQLQQDLEKYQAEHGRFLADFAAYDPSRAADKTPDEHQRQYRELLQRRAALEAKRLKLRAAHAAALEQEKLGVQAKSGLQAAWLAKLTHGRTLADEAVRQLRRQEVYPSLQFAAMCNAAQLIEAQARYTTAARDTGIQQAVSELDAAVNLIERQRTRAFGDDVARAEFFAQYQTAFDLLVQFHLEAYARREDEQHLVHALVAAEQCRSRALLDQRRMACIEDPGGVAAENGQAAPGYLAALIRRYRDAKQPTLYYYVGAARSYLFMLGGTQAGIRPIRLRDQPDAADRSSVASDASSRRIDLHVGRLHASMSDPQGAATFVGDKAARRRLAASSLVLLPLAAREYLQRERAAGASHVVVVPQGALTQLPLEVLVLDDGAHLYLDDVAPPLAYAPSLALLDHLSESQPASQPAPTVLTLGNPRYAPRPDANASPAPRAAVGAGRPPGDERASPSAGLPALPESQKECDRIEKLFGSTRVTKLDGSRATEQRLRDALRSRRYDFVHLAAHGILRTADLNPWLALAPPQDPHDDPAADGRLELSEIYRLNLTDCELTVLSACDTNLDARQTIRLRSLPVGRGDQPSGLAAPTLDTSFSIANAFLAAGSRRVLGTHWSVPDDSTADLVGRLFEKLRTELAAHRPINYARLLNAARRESRRSNPRWDTPFHWAPFVLIGPAKTPAAR